MRLHLSRPSGQGPGLLIEFKFAVSFKRNTEVGLKSVILSSGISDVKFLAAFLKPILFLRNTILI